VTLTKGQRQGWKQTKKKNYIYGNFKLRQNADQINVAFKL
jgi:hypothetical protein